jgi:hypothetical protein
MVKNTIRAGLAVRVAAQADGRKSCMELSPRGREIVKAVRGARARYFASRMKGWPRADRRDFARLLVLFAQSGQTRRHEPVDNDNSASRRQPFAEGAATSAPDAPMHTDATKRRLTRTGKRNRTA